MPTKRQLFLFIWGWRGQLEQLGFIWSWEKNGHQMLWFNQIQWVFYSGRFWGTHRYFSSTERIWTLALFVTLLLPIVYIWLQKLGFFLFVCKRIPCCLSILTVNWLGTSKNKMESSMFSLLWHVNGSTSHKEGYNK